MPLQSTPPLLFHCEALSFLSLLGTPHLSLRGVLHFSVFARSTATKQSQRLPRFPFATLRALAHRNDDEEVDEIAGKPKENLDKEERSDI